jgi:hypothetical protein
MGHRNSLALAAATDHHAPPVAAAPFLCSSGVTTRELRSTVRWRRSFNPCRAISSHHGKQRIIDRDFDGYEFSDVEATREEAHKLASELIFDALADGTNAREIIEVTDEAGRVVLRLECAAMEELPA